jgi:hypothetical protein
MATVTPSNRTRSLDQSHQQVRHPLERLRGYIRAYVSLEGAAFVGLFLALWFWIGLFLDYGVFRLSGLVLDVPFDWVQETPWGLRLVVLLVLVSALLAGVALKVLTRLLREFRDSSLALVLERRFPEQLGDRLITAVELADTRRAVEQGYSLVMVQETIHEAGDRVAHVPIKEVFDWKRLYVQGALFLGLTLGLYLLVGGLFVGLDAASANANLGGFGGLNETAGIWFERNVLLQDTIWPRRAHLELVDFPESGTLLVGRDDPPPGIKVRALVYIISGAPEKQAVQAYETWLKGRKLSEDQRRKMVEAFAKKPAEGWRALTWFDLTPKLLGAEVPENLLPAEWQARNPAVGLTLDEVALKMEKPELRQALSPDTRKGLEDLLERLDERAAQSDMKRTLRKLTVPAEVVVSTRGPTTVSTIRLTRGPDNEFTGRFSDLKESRELPWDFKFRAKGEDYATAERTITVVAPPALEELILEQSQPAYLFYRPNLGDAPGVFRGKKQLLAEDHPSLQGGDTTRIDVPGGTDVVLTARANKPLKEVWIEPRKEGETIKEKAELLPDGRIRVAFANVRLEKNFLFKFRSDEGVVGQRHLVLKPRDDVAPLVDAAPEVIRKTKEGYMVTPLARIPFAGTVRDDNGLGTVRYAYTIAPAESKGGGVSPKQSLSLASSVPLLAAQPGGQLAAIGVCLGLARGTASSAGSESASRTGHVVLPRFLRALEDRRDEYLPMTRIEELLRQPQKLHFRGAPGEPALLAKFDLVPDNWFRADEDPSCDFALWKEQPNLKVTDERAIQPRYKMLLWVEALDTDVESEQDRDGTPRPHLSTSKDKFPFIIVSEVELLAEIAIEEEKLHIKLEETLNLLIDTEKKLERVNQDLSGARVQARDLGPMSARTEEIDQVLEKGLTVTSEVLTDYQRILKELKTNRVDTKMVERVEKGIVQPLAEVKDVEFDAAAKANANFRKALDDRETDLLPRLATARKAGAEAKKQLRELIDAIRKVIDNMQGLTDVNKLIKMLRAIEETEQSQAEVFRIRKEKAIDDLFKGLDKKP